jgi:hypothetical protein
MHPHCIIRKSQAGEQLLDALAGRSPGSENRGGFSTERVDHLRGIDAAATRGLAAIENVTAVLKYQAIRGNDAIQSWING